MNNLCQSCSMPMEDVTLRGTNNDGSSSEDYCVYCYKDGEFLEDVTMQEMMETCVPHMVNSGMKEEDARKMLQNTLPKLKRWC
ncbi:zinc ribbon domain-containing protein [Clostridium polynesiense]|uniref:zinc ribbon domain-containing protein n=1 Tax=Clostridium polynesiense TaxID=1325933 RepID=UPI00058DC646|nr:zinc ribbon domain-containing protein [Clostridium polynesiense]